MVNLQRTSSLKQRGMLNLTDEQYARFHRALSFTIPHEGGYVNDSEDAGGETKWGISKRYHPDEDIVNLTPERAAEIYWNDYWLPAGCEDLPLPTSTIVFDTAVLCGVGRTCNWVRECQGDMNCLLDKRKASHLQSVKNFPVRSKFLKGWVIRIYDLQHLLETT